MTAMKAMQRFEEILRGYESLKNPKYKEADLDTLKGEYEELLQIRDHVKVDPRYQNLVNGLSQVIRRLELNFHGAPESNWRTVSERGVNKAIVPVVRKRNQDKESPFQWTEDKTGQTCEINKGLWGCRNFMAMDVLGYILLLKEGKDILPKENAPLFENLESISRREKELDAGKVPVPSDPSDSESPDIERIRKERYFIKFTDRDFRKFTSLDLNSNEIMNLLLETSRVEFKIVFPVRLLESKTAKEKSYRMNMFSRPFEFGYLDKEIRSDGVVQCREYYVSFNTLLGEMFAHNLLTKNYDWLDHSFYQLPQSAQLLYRRFLLNNNFPRITLNLQTIADKINLQDKNITNLVRTIEESALRPLVKQGLIDRYEKAEDGLDGIKFILHRTRKVKPVEEINP
jgi:hypothetical protein